MTTLGARSKQQVAPHLLKTNCYTLHVTHFFLSGASLTFTQTRDDVERKVTVRNFAT